LISEQGAGEGFTLIVIGCGSAFGCYRDCRFDEAKPNPLQEDIALPALRDDEVVGSVADTRLYHI
jgi:hypothetical protein